MAEKELGRYQTLRAARLFSLVVALVNGGVALALAHRYGSLDSFNAVLVMLGCILLQLGVNLINDLADIDPDSRQAGGLQRQIRKNAYLGGGCFAIALVVALYLISDTGWPLLIFCLVGIIGALGYTCEPVNYKRRGLGVVLVFWLMGILMISGGAYAASGLWSWQIAALSIPVSLYTSLLLLSNEIRDYHSDLDQGIFTLTTRLGLASSKRLFIALLVASYLLVMVFYWQGLLEAIWPVFISLILLPGLLKIIGRPSPVVALPPRTGAVFLIFGAGYISVLLNLPTLN